jgi:hypothetical protein
MRYNRENRRRYYLHKRIRERYLIAVPQRTIYIPYNELNKIPEQYFSFCMELGNKKGYVIQVCLE